MGARISTDTEFDPAYVAGGARKANLPFNLGDYDTDPTGDIDSTAAIQEAIDEADAAGGGRVVGVPGSTYLVSGSGATRTFPSVGVTVYEYALSVPSNITLDFTDCTIKFATGETTTVLLTNADATNENITLIGTIDGNGVPLSNRALVWFEGITGLTLDVSLLDTYRNGLYIIDCDDVKGDIHADTCTGVPVQLGTPNYPVTNSHFERIVVKNVVADPVNTFNFPGNGILAVLENCSIGSIHAVDTAAGIKIQDFENITINSVIGERVGKTDVSGTADTTNGSPNLTNVSPTTGWANGQTVFGTGIPIGTTISSGAGTATMVMSANATATATGVAVIGSSANSGLKLQVGAVGANARAKVGNVVMSECDGAGLYMDAGTDCEVTTYDGSGNATLGNTSDVWIDGTRPKIGTVRSKNAGGVAILFRNTAADAQIDTALVTNPNRLQIANTHAIVAGTGSAHISSAVVSDANSYMTRAVSQSGAGILTLGHLKASGWASAAYSFAGAVTATDVVAGPPAYARVIKS